MTEDLLKEDHTTGHEEEYNILYLLLKSGLMGAMNEVILTFLHLFAYIKEPIHNVLIRGDVLELLSFD